MTTYMYKIATIAVALIFSVSTATADDLSRKVNKTFDVTKGDKLSIDTKFGDVKITESNSDKVVFDVTITIEGDGSKEKKIFESIKVNLTKEGNTVMAITDFPSTKNMKKVSVDYVVTAPAYLHFDLIQKFGDAYVEHFDGKCDIEVKFGNLNAGALPNKENQIELKYVDNALIGALSNAKLDIGYSELTVKKASFLEIESGYSEVEIQDLHSLVLIAKYDEYEIGTAENLNIDAKYTDIDVEKVTRKLIYDGSFGDLDVDNITAGFDEIKLNVKYNDCDLNIADDAAYNLKAEAGFADIDYDSGKFKGSVEKGMNSFEVEGTINGGGKAKVTVETSFGDVEL